ncbi:hypothetical protein Tco_1051383, partial [Tanacetum coccineum]
DDQQDWEIVTWRLYEACGVYILELKDAIVIYMLVERRYPLSKDLLQRMLDIGLEVEREIQDQTVLGKDYSNLLIADSLLKTIWFINAPCYGNEALTSPKANDFELAIPERTTTGKGKSNPFMAAKDVDEDGKCLKIRSGFVKVFGYILQELKKINLKKHEVKQVQQSCLGEDCWELFITNLVPLASCKDLFSLGLNVRGSGTARGQDAAPAARECTFAGFKRCNPTTFRSTEGAVKLLRWFEKTESVFGISNCAEGKKVKFAVATLQGPALTWWNARIETMGLETVKEYNIVAYTQRFNKLALMCPRMVEPKRVKVDAYIRGLADNIKGEALVCVCFVFIHTQRECLVQHQTSREPALWSLFVPIAPAVPSSEGNGYSRKRAKRKPKANKSKHGVEEGKCQIIPCDIRECLVQHQTSREPALWSLFVPIAPAVPSSEGTADL